MCRFPSYTGGVDRSIAVRSHQLSVGGSCSRARCWRFSHCRAWLPSPSQSRGCLAPPIVVGLYRYTRNPMYVAVTLVLLGWGVSFGLSGLFTYTLIVAVAFHLRVVL